MTVFRNATAFLVAISIIIAILVAQRGYQNSWHEPAALASPHADTVSQVRDKHYQVDHLVME
jgi:hypothetical protein